MRRFKPGGVFQQRTELALKTLEYPPVTAAGLTATEDGVGAETSRHTFASAGEAIWWAKLEKRYSLLRRRVKVRFTDPEGAIVKDTVAEKLSKGHIGARLPLTGRVPGPWQVEAVLDGQVIDRRSFVLSGS